MNKHLLALVTLPLLLAAPVAAQDEPRLPKPVGDEVHALLLAGGDDLAQAMVALGELRENDPERDGTWQYLEALTLARQGESDQAAQRLEALMAAFPSGPYAEKARFLRAELLIELGRFEEAQAILDAAAVELRATERRDELAATCLTLVAEDTAVDPDAPLGDRDPRRLERLNAALPLLAELHHLDLSADTRRQVLALGADIHGELARHAERSAALAAWLELAEEGATPPDITAVREMRLEAAVAMGLAGRAGTARERLDVLAVELVEAGLADGDLAGRVDLERSELRRRLGSADRRDEAIAILEAHLTTRLAHPGRTRVAFDVAELQLEAGRPDVAIEAWRRLLDMGRPGEGAEQSEREQDTELRMEARWRIAERLLSAGAYDEAITGFAEYVALYPSGPRWGACQAAIIDAEHDRAADLALDGRHVEARSAWRTFLEDHPVDPRVREVQRRLADSFGQEAAEREEEGAGDEARALWASAIDELDRIARKLPGSDHASSALYRIGRIQEDELGDLSAAISAYRRCDFGSHHWQAQSRLAAMLDQHLSVSTRSVWRPGDGQGAPELRLVTRNLTEVEVELYRLDLESYFRRHRTHRDVAELDLDLIQADEVFTHLIDVPQQHAMVTEDLTLPIDGAGAWVVVVVAKEERATTLVLASDLDLVVESNAEEALVLVQDRAERVPVAGARVLISMGAGGAMAEGTTGPDGVARVNLTELGTPRAGGPLAVLVDKGGHLASCGMQLTGMPLIAEPASAGFLHTDRGTYRAGDRVHWRAILRDGDRESGWTFEPERPYRVSLSSPGGVELFSEVARLGAFGTLEGSFDLPESAARGTWQLAVSDDRDHHSMALEVADFAVPRTRLSVVPGALVLLPGQTQTFELTATYAHGAPMAGKRLFGRVGRQGELQVELTTDVEGRATWSLPLSALEDLGGSIPWSFRLAEEGRGTSGSFHVAAREFELALATGRELVLADEAFGLDVTTRDLAGEPTARRLELRVVRHGKDARGQATSVLVHEAELETDETGRARAELSLAEGGRHELRVSGLDALGNPVRRELFIEVSDEDDTTRLRFLVDRSRYELGEQVALRLHNRSEPGPALVVFEGDGILDYRVVELDRGDNSVDFTAAMLHWPNTTLRVDLIGDERLHRVSQEIQVDRGLALELETGGDSFAPGDTAEVRLRLLDGLGSPVAGEFAVSLVDAAFLDRFGDPTGDPRAIFEDRRRRQANLQAATSAGFVYDGVTTAISAAVLAEGERRRAEVEFKERLKDARGFLSQAEDKAALGVDLRALGYAEDAEADSPFESESINDMIGIGGGAGGKFGGRKGGRGAFRGPGDVAAPGAEEDGSEVVTAFWRADLTTGSDGRATLSMPLPDRGGAWRLALLGVDSEARTTRADTELVTTAPVLVDLELPGALREGDRFDAQARVHVQAAGTVHLTLDVRGFGEELVREARLEVDGPGSHTLDLGTFEVPRDAVAGDFRLRAILDDGSDREDEGLAATDGRRLAVRPYGTLLSDSATGYLDAPRSVTLALTGTELRRGQLEVHVGAGLAAELMAAALGREPLQPRSALHPSTDDLAQDLLGGATLLAALEAEGAGGTGELRRRVRGLTAEVLARQGKGGGWSMTGFDGSFRHVTSAWCLLALEAAAEVVEVPQGPSASAVTDLSAALSAINSLGDGPRGLVLHALARAGAIGHDKLASLFRSRDGADSTTLAHLALAYAALGRDGEAAQLGELLDRRIDADGGFGPGAEWCRDELRTTAVAVWALAHTNPGATSLDAAARTLRDAAPWGPGRRRGLAVTALTSQVQRSITDRGELRVSVTVNGEPAGELLLPRGAAGRTLRSLLPEEALTGELAVGLTAIEDGRRSADWRPTFHARLSAWESLPAAPDPRSGAAMKLTYEAAAPRLETPDGSIQLDTGFSILGVHQGRDENHWQNLVTHLTVGDRLRVTARAFGLPPEWPGLREHLEYELPLPAGTTLVPGSIHGTHLDWSLADGSLYLRGAYPGLSQITFELIGTTVGTFRVPPARSWSAEAPDEVQLGYASELTVIAPGAASPDVYRPTPDELFDRGTRLYLRGDLDGAAAALLPLHRQFAGLFEDRTAASLAEMLLTLSIRSGDAAGTVASFESLLEHDPDHFLTLDQVVAVGRAYRDLGEHERSARLFQATLAESFGTDLRLAGALDRFGDPEGSLALLDRLWLDYPDLPAVIETRLVLTDQLLTRSSASSGGERVGLLLESTLYLREFLALYPDHALAPDAGMNLLTAYLDLEDHGRVERLAARLAARFIEPKLRDEFRYTRAVAAWYQDEVATALDLLSEIVTARYEGERGREEFSPNRDLALFLSAQIYHADGELEKASGLYTKVKERFAEAAELLTLFDERRLALPEVTRVAPDAEVSLELTHKGVDRVELQLFPVDLMTLYLREGSLEDVSDVNLAGISPVRTGGHDLDAPIALDDATSELALGRLEPGAYLAILRGEGRFTSGLVLVTELELVVREDPGAGAVRVEVKRGEERLADVDVRVVGSADGVFHSGETDRRGLYTTSGISGLATVIARLDRSTYAFHRGTTPMGVASQTGSSHWFLDQGEGGEQVDEEAVDWLEEQRASNVMQQGSRRANLEQNWNKRSRGVQVQKIQ